MQNLYTTFSYERWSSFGIITLSQPTNLWFGVGATMVKDSICNPARKAARIWYICWRNWYLPQSPERIEKNSKINSYVCTFNFLFIWHIIIIIIISSGQLNHWVLCNLQFYLSRSSLKCATCLFIIVINFSIKEISLKSTQQK